EALLNAARQHQFDPTGWESEVNVNCLLIDTGSRRILFDVGIGSPALYPQSGYLRDSLRAAGVEAEEVDSVIFTHGHWDHVAGLADAEGSLLFPNASYLMQMEEWAFWTDKTNVSLLNPAFADFDPISFERLALIADRMRVFAAEEEILPGIQALPAQGHTPGHSAFLIESESQRLLHISDLIHETLHFEYPDWVTSVDIDPKRTPASRRKIFTRAADEKLLVFGCHTPHFGLGHIVASGAAWRWEPTHQEIDR
ncbi:MAG: MBL fold metallo-hydrolase, partial [Chloroflexota bacterium]